MFQRRTRVGAAVLGSLAIAGLALGQAPVHADPAPQQDDVVGVGSDIIQNSVNFLADGFSDGTLGYNAAGNQHRIFNYDAGADANGRNAFVDPKLLASGTTLAQVPTLNPSVQLKAGTSPVQRPNGGSAGLTALYGDGSGLKGSAGRLIDYVRSPNAPSASAATAPGKVGALHTIQFATDTQYIATATTTNAPSYLTATDLYKIYTGAITTWSQIDHYDGADASAHIVPLIPQNGAGVLNIFLKAVNAGKPSGAADLSLSNTVATQVQQNDPSTITNLATAEKPNAIVPFPEGRYKLLGSGYFKDPNKAYNPAANGADANYTLGNSGISLIRPGAGGSASAFKATIPYYIVFREADIDDSRTWQPGSTLNWVKTLFYNPAYQSDPASTPPPFFASPAAATILKKIGLTPQYVASVASAS